MADKTALLRQRTCGLAVKTDHANRLANLVSNDSYWLVQVCVLRKNKRDVEEIAPSIMNQVCSKVHIRTLLFRVPNFRVRRASWYRMYQRLNLREVKKLP